MADEKIRPADLPSRTNPVASEIIPSDNGSIVGGVSWLNGVNAARPFASQAQAEAGTSFTTAMNPLTTKQHVDKRIADGDTVPAGDKGALTVASGVWSLNAGVVDDTALVAFGSTSPSADKIKFEAPISSPALRSVSARLWDKPSVRDWGALGNDVDDTAAAQAAATYCSANGMALYIPRGAYATTDSIDLTNGFPILGDGHFVSRIIPRNFNGPAFRYVTSGGVAINYPKIRDLEILFDFPDEEAPHDLTAGIEFAGDAGFIQEGTFSNLFIRGAHSAFKSSKPTYTTIFGEEGTVNWNRYENIHVADYQRATSYGWNFPAGSGTGNLWTGIRTRMSDPDAWLWLFGGTDCVVGDILILDSNIGGPANGFKGDDNTIYRRNIRIAGCQFDGNVLVPVQFSSVGSIGWSDYDIKDNNYGGGTSLDNLPLAHGSRYTGNEFGRLEDGKRILLDGTGTQAAPVFRVHLDENSACVIEFSVAGTVSGLGGGVERLVALASRQGSGVPGVAAIDQTQSPAVAGFPSVTTATAGDYVEFGYSCAPTLAGTKLNAQVVVQNGTVRIEQV